VVFYQRSVIDYQSGDVVVVKRPNGEEFVKRVVAVAGDTVNILNGEVYVNGEEIVFDGQIGDTEVMSSEIENPYVVGEDQVYVLGDNRVNSEDSRMFGAVNVSELKGRLLWYMGKL
jgi:signal peptidase I